MLVVLLKRGGRGPRWDMKDRAAGGAGEGPVQRAEL